MALNDPVDWREPAREPGAAEGQTPCFALVLAGGVALGAFEACAYAALHERRIAPGSIEAAATRRWDLIFANQTHRAIEAHAREERLQRRIGRLAAELARHDRAAAADGALRLPPLHLFRLTYRPLPDEAGPERQFDFSRRSVAAQWAAGQRAMEELIGREGVRAGLAARAAVGP